MKTWKRPILVKMGAEQLNENVRAAAFTCLWRFVR